MDIRDIIELEEQIRNLKQDLKSLKKDFIADNAKFAVGEIVLDPYGRMSWVSGRHLHIVGDHLYTITYKLKVVNKANRKTNKNVSTKPIPEFRITKYV